MYFYFKNPVALILYKTIYGTFPKTAIFVKQNRLNRGKPRDIHFHKVEESRLENSITICKRFSINLEVIDWNTFIKLRGICFESSLINNGNEENSVVIFQTSDVYTVIGFSKYLNVTYTKIKLNLYWKSRIDTEAARAIYIYNPNKLPVPNMNFKTISLDNLRNNFVEISDFMLPQLFKKSELHLNNHEQYILALPPSNLRKSNFRKQFMNEVFEMANSLKQKIILKPHRNDLYDYREYIDSDNIIKCNFDEFKYFEVEYLFGYNNINKIIAYPSSALVFADYSKQLILAPKNRDLFRRHMTDQLVFFQYSGLEYKRI